MNILLFLFFLLDNIIYDFIIIRFLFGVLLYVNYLFFEIGELFILFLLGRNF